MNGGQNGVMMHDDDDSEEGMNSFYKITYRISSGPGRERDRGCARGRGR